MAQMPGRCAKDQQSEPMAAPPRHIIEPLPHWLDPLEIMMPPEQRLETWIILRADQPDLQLIQNGLFFDLGQTIWLRHPRNLKKLAAGVQSKVSIPLSRAVFHILMSQPWGVPTSSIVVLDKSWEKRNHFAFSREKSDLRKYRTPSTAHTMHAALELRS